MKTHGLFYLAICVACVLPQYGCGTKEDSSGDERTPNTGGGEGRNTTSTAKSECNGAFTQLPAPYAVNTGFFSASGFAVDEQGLVLSAMPDLNRAEKNAEYSARLLSVDLAGKATTLYEEKNAFMSDIVLDGENVHFQSGFSSLALIRVPRVGGAPTVLVKDSLLEGPVTDGRRIYYFADDPTLGSTLFAIEKTSDVPEVISARGNTIIDQLAYADSTFYWIEGATYTAETSTLYSFRIGDPAAKEFSSLPFFLSGDLSVVNGTVFITRADEALDIHTYRIDPGQAPTSLGETGWAIFFVDGVSYYLSGTGVTKDSLTFENPTTVPGTYSKSVSAVAVGPTELWYGTMEGCLYRTPK